MYEFVKLTYCENAIAFTIYSVRLLEEYVSVDGQETPLFLLRRYIISSLIRMVP